MSRVKQRFLDYFFPNSVAIIGAIRDEKVLSFNFLNNLIRQGFKGRFSLI